MIALEGLSKVYPQQSAPVEVFRDVNLNLEAGEFIALTGTSGAGKTTLLQLLGCLDQPSAGSYRFRGRETAHMSEAELAALRNRHIGFVFQNSYFIDYLDLLENVALPGFYSRGVSAPDARARAEELLDSVGIGHRGAHTPAKLSGGERQRAAIARALFNRPQLLLADEPTGNLDAGNSARIIELLETLNRSGITVLLVTHDNAIACRAQRRVQLCDGCLREL